MSDIIGICRLGHNLVWGHNHGALVKWPYWIKHLIVFVWNHIGCTLFGHIDLVQDHRDDPIECACCTRAVRVSGHDVDHIIKIWKIDLDEVLEEVRDFSTRHLCSGTEDEVFVLLPKRVYEMVLKVVPRRKEQ